MGKYTVFTDGSCLGNPGPGGWAAYIQEMERMASGELARTTNNEAEMMAVLYGLAEIPDGSEVVVYTDSSLVIGWLCKGYRIKSNPKIQDIKDGIGQIRDAKRLAISFRQVKGHAGMPGNEKVDWEARRRAERAKHLPTSEDRITSLQLTLNVAGLDITSAGQILRAIEKLGGIASGLIEGIDEDLEPVGLVKVEDGKILK